PDPEIKAYPDAVYFNFYSLGVSLLFTPANGYKPKTGPSRTKLRDKDLGLDSLDIYKSQRMLVPRLAIQAPVTVLPFPALPISIPKPDNPESILQVTQNTTGKGFRRLPGRA
ncbi:hypothetical protein M407DRAFT_223243, partial [Tulasnella calospora MUT 4182]